MFNVYSQIRFGETNAPFKSLNYDSLIFFKCDNSEVKNWTVLPDIFQNGIEAVYQGKRIVTSEVGS